MEAHHSLLGGGLGTPKGTTNRAILQEETAIFLLKDASFESSYSLGLCFCLKSIAQFFCSWILLSKMALTNLCWLPCYLFLVSNYKSPGRSHSCPKEGRGVSYGGSTFYWPGLSDLEGSDICATSKENSTRLCIPNNFVGRLFHSKYPAEVLKI